MMPRLMVFWTSSSLMDDQSTFQPTTSERAPIDSPIDTVETEVVSFAGTNG